MFLTFVNTQALRHRSDRAELTANEAASYSLVEPDRFEGRLHDFAKDFARQIQELHFLEPGEGVM